MNILLINKFYYPRGGDCTATLSLETLLKSKGHNVAIFSSAHKENNDSEWSSYFPSEINFASPNLKEKIKAVMRIFFSREVKRKFLALVKDFKPDIVHVHNIHSYLSPYVVQLAAQKNIKVVWTLHDYKLICPSYSCLNKGKTCTLCYKDKKHVILNKCMKNSLLASVLAYAEAQVWNKNRLKRYTSYFVSPSFFLRNQMINGGFNSENIKVLHNFMYKDLPQIFPSKADYYCYVGRISEEKGIEDLLRTANKMPYKLKVIGGGEDLPKFKEQYNSPNIDYVGYLPTDKVWEIVQKARFTVVPSVCFENNPFSIIESLCLGTPVLGARIGGIPELIEKDVNGMTFRSGNEEDMKVKIEQMFKMEFDYQRIAEEARLKYSSENYYSQLMELYKA